MYLKKHFFLSFPGTFTPKKQLLKHKNDFIQVQKQFLKALAILFSTRQQLLKVINMQKYPKNEFIYVSGLDGITFYSCWK